MLSKVNGPTSKGRKSNHRATAKSDGFWRQVQEGEAGGGFCRRFGLFKFAKKYSARPENRHTRENACSRALLSENWREFEQNVWPEKTDQDVNRQTAVNDGLHKLSSLRSGGFEIF